MRDIPLLLGFLVMTPLILTRPYLGVLAWCWTALLVPNTYVYGIAEAIRFNLWIAVATIVAWPFSKRPKAIPLDATSILLGALLVWGTVSAIFTMAPIARDTWMEWERLAKTLMLSLAVMAFIRTQTRIIAMLFAIVLSMGFHGFLEAGKFILSGGGHKIWGPGNSIIGDNNSFALAIIMTIPVLAYLYLQFRNLLLRVMLGGGIFLLVLTVIGTRSRGGLIGITALAFWVFVTTKKKLVFLVVALPLTFLALAFAPEHWYERMRTIEDVEQDSSFMGRVIAWKIITLAALEHPLTGAGFRSTQDLSVWHHFSQNFSALDVIPTSRPDTTMAHAAHSIYFQVLGDLGFVGLALYLMLLAVAWRNASLAVAQARSHAEFRWAHDLGRTFQYCLIPFFVSGAALNMAYFDLAFAIFGLAAVLRSLTKVPATASAPRRIGVSVAA
jgi:probable O-glycosylation ligase (exosortase A-associated)